jgi:tRNA (adenine22-N1)-methyltransferase
MDSEIKEVRLSKRLATIVSFVKDGNLLDIGSDHGYVPIALAQNGFKYGLYASEKGEGPLSHLNGSIEGYGLKDKITCFQADGLKGLKDEYQIKQVVITGMGGLTIAEILNLAGPAVSAFDYVIIEPQSEMAEARECCNKLGLKEDQEAYVEEKGKIYPIIRYVQGKEKLTKAQLAYGKLALENKDPLLLKMLTNAQTRVKAIIDSGKVKDPNSLKYLKKQLTEAEKGLKAYAGKAAD